MSDFDQDDGAMKPFEVKSDELSESDLNQAIQNYIQPEGADFGLTAAAFEAKERVVRKQISTGSLRVISDPGSETIQLMSSQDWRGLVAKLK